MLQRSWEPNLVGRGSVQIPQMGEQRLTFRASAWTQRQENKEARSQVLGTQVSEKLK